MVACMASCHLHIPGGDCFPHSLLYFCHALAFGCMGYLPQHTLLSRSHTHTHTHSCARERADVMWLTGSCLCAWCSCLCAIVERGGSGFKAFGLCVCIRAFACVCAFCTTAHGRALSGAGWAKLCPSPVYSGAYNQPTVPYPRFSFFAWVRVRFTECYSCLCSALYSPPPSTSPSLAVGHANQVAGALPHWSHQHGGLS